MILSEQLSADADRELGDYDRRICAAVSLAIDPYR